MTTVTLRKKLHEYIADADDKKIKGMFLFLEDEIEKKNHAKGLSNSYNWMEAKEIIMGNKSRVNTKPDYLAKSSYNVAISLCLV